MTIFEQIKQYLQNHAVEFETAHHAPTRTSAEAARVRGVDLAIGGKALVLKVDEAFKLFVISAARRIDSKKIRRYFGARKVRFATAAELWELTGLLPGGVPPFGKPILELELYADYSITQNEQIAFNAGSLTDSITMRTADYLQAARPQVFDFSQT